MFSTLWENLSKSLGSRWLLISFGPALVFWGLSLLLYGEGSRWAFTEAWYAYPAWFQAALLTGALAGVVGTAYLLDLLSLPLLRLAEGYGWQRASVVGRWARKWVETRKSQAKADQERFSTLQVRRVLAAQGQGEPLTEADWDELLALEKQLYYRPPDPAHSMPTDLGDVLRAAEEAVRARYGLDPIVCWPRLYPLLPGSLRADLGTARSNLELGLRVGLLSALFALIWATWSLASALWILALVALSGLAVAWLGYRLAVLLAVPYADLIRAAFDLHRFDLYRQLGWSLPRSPAEERPAAPDSPPTIGQRLSQYLWRGEGADDMQFDHVSQKTTRRRARPSS